MADKMRMTAHNGRASKKGVYTAKHNDRNFDLENSDHIDAERSAGNWYWNCYNSDMTFEEAEARYYEEHFREALDERNDKQIANRHPERVATMDDYRHSKKSCPEEQIMQIGCKGNSVDAELLKKIAIKQINWEQKHYPQCKLLDVALHTDEQGAPHIHKRVVWVGHDDAGREVVGQSKALAEMGVHEPDPNKKYGRSNNAKMTYTAKCREHLAQVCKEHGLDLELTPKEHSKSGLALEEYKAQQEQEKARQAQLEAEQARQAEQQAREQIASMQSEMARMASEKADMEKSTRKAQKALKEAENALSAMPDKQQELDSVKAQLKTARQELKKTLDMKARASEIRRPLFHSEPTVRYHENMLESTRAIGSEAYEHMRDAESKLSQVAKRETAVRKKEQEIEPLHKKAKAEYDKAHEYREQQESYILGTAEKQAQEKFDAFISREFGQELTGRGARLEQFADSLTMKDGRSVLDAFNEQEQERQLKLSQSWGYER